MKHTVKIPEGCTIEIKREGNILTINTVEQATKKPSIIDTLKNGDIIMWKETRRKPYTYVPIERTSLGVINILHDETRKVVLVAQTDVHSEDNKIYKYKKEHIILDNSFFEKHEVVIADFSYRSLFMKRLRDQCSLSLKDGAFVNWKVNDEYDDSKYYTYLTGSLQIGNTLTPNKYLMEVGNMFPADFITDEKLQEYRENMLNLFNKWRTI